MRNIKFFVVVAALVLVGVGGWIASATTKASAVKFEGASPHGSTPVGGGLSTLPLIF
jgi:hypothetical protein